MTSSQALGLSVPPFTPHAISVSLPTWQDNVDYEEGKPRVKDAMVCGYPRFFIHPSIQKVADICQQKFGTPDELCLLFPSNRVASECRRFIEARSSLVGPAISARLTHFVFPEAELHVVLFPTNAYPIAKQFWQHAGLGISSRLAEFCLSGLAESSTPPKSPEATARFPLKPSNRHYSVKPPAKEELAADKLDSDHSTYLEERYGRNLPREHGMNAKRALRRRIAGVLANDSPECSRAGEQDVATTVSSRGADVTEGDVYLLPSGMAAIWYAHQAALAVRPAAKSVCFGFPYTDTLKILEKWGPGCYHLGRGLDEDIDELETILESTHIVALFTEFPSNPLLRSANLPRLRALADKHEFLIVIDETIGNFVNVRVQPYADVVVSSLTKVFSGYSNVMGGSLVLNPQGRYYGVLKRWLDDNYEDVYFDQDAIFMERNSRNFRSRSHAINRNAETICDFLLSRSIAGDASSSSTSSRSSASAPVIKEVYYPKYITRHNYETCRITQEGAEESDGKEEGGYGGLFSLTFTTQEASEAFFDAIPCYKGPSLGTNFTLASPYTILAHYAELEWAAQWGVEKGLVRISVGMEDTKVLLEWFGKALLAAEATLQK
ncbi:hypothetical protein PLEOSDRAFT_1074412 [Pleurotus ostreatus PC15]|uniref:cystathionine gamma-synthase n=1 Tax=Pleurotus ostreatus (strain PC15) TaxID=1137138 RepID=A0A067NVB3_PLEO1|nr:hypothetical protein PLEOSDRAFT_1074412 [Pleurotus ostreatus PC15]